jgi:hypothetical protein
MLDFPSSETYFDSFDASDLAPATAEVMAAGLGGL